LRPMIRIVIREALALYAQLAVRISIAAAVIFLPFAIGLLFLDLTVPESTRANQGLAIVDAVGSLLLFAPLVSILTIRLAFRRERDEPIKPLDELMDTFGLLPSYVITQLLAILVIIALPGILIAIGFATGSPLIVSAGVGTLLASVIINGIRLTLATIPVVTGDARFATALRRSSQLTKGRYWITLGTVAAATVVALAIALLLSVITLAAPIGIARSSAEAVVGLITNAITIPLITLVLYRLYRRLAEDRPNPPTAA